MVAHLILGELIFIKEGGDYRKRFEILGLRKAPLRFEVRPLVLKVSGKGLGFRVSGLGFWGVGDTLKVPSGWRV